MLRFACPKCKQVLQAADTQAGQVMACPQCKSHVRAPAAVPTALPAAAPPSRRSAEPPAREAPDRRDDEREWRPDLDERDEPAEHLLRELPAKMTKEMEELGVPRAVFRPSLTPRILCFVFGGAALLAGLLASLFVALVLILNRRAGLAQGMTLGLWGVLLLLAGAGLLSAGIFLFRRRVLVCQEGVAHVKTGGGVDACRWDQIRSTFQSVTNVRIYNRYGMHIGTRVDRVYTVVRDDGLRLVFTNRSCDGVEDLWHRIQREATRRLTPTAFDAVVRDRRVLSFGGVGVGIDGVHCGADVLPWDQVGGLSLYNGRASIHFRDGGDFTSIAVNQIPNLHVFLNLVENLSGKRWR